MTSLRLLAAAALAAPAIAFAAPASAGGSGPHAGAQPAPTASIQAEHLAHHHFRARCVAAAFRAEGRGPRIRGTRGVGFARFPRRACRRAVRECVHRLQFAPAGPYARCIVLRVS